MVFRTWPEIVEMKDKEIDDLKDRIDELENEIKHYEKDDLDTCPCGDGYWFFGTEVHCMSCGTTVSGVKASKSLAIIKAKTLRDEAKEFLGVGSKGGLWTNEDIAEELNLSADRIEQEGS